MLGFCESTASGASLPSEKSVSLPALDMSATCMSRSSSDQPKAVICCTVELPSSPAASAVKAAGVTMILCLRSHSP